MVPVLNTTKFKEFWSNVNTVESYHSICYDFMWYFNKAFIS